MADMTKLQKELRQQESKLATLTIINGALQKENEQLRKGLEAAQQPGSLAEEELLDLKEEFARRLGAADRTVAELREERDRLRGRIATADQGGTASSAKLQERDAHISSLQAEGEKLSRRNGELEATTRRLRGSLRETETERDRLLGRSQGLEEQLLQEQDRYAAATQAAAAQLESLEGELNSTRSAAQQQIAQARKEAASAVSAARQAAADGGAQSLAHAAEREAALQRQAAELRTELDEAEGKWGEQQAVLQREVFSLEHRLRSLESQNSELQAAASEGVQPLLRNIEAMAAQASAQQHAASEAERSLLARLKQAERAAATAVAAQQLAQRQAAAAESALTASRNAAAEAAAAVRGLTADLDAARQHGAGLEAELARTHKQYRAALQQLEQQQEQFEAAQAQLERKLAAAQEMASLLQAQHREMQQQQLAEPRQPPLQHQTSQGTARLQSLGHDSSGAQEPRHSQQLAREAGRGHGNGLDTQQQEVEEEPDEMEGLMRTLSPASSSIKAPWPNGKTPDARVRSLERRLAAAEVQLQTAQANLLAAYERADAADRDAEAARDLQQQLQDWEAKYDMALELLGERNERVDQLEDDILEMKGIFHAQLGLMADQLSMAKPQGS